MNFEQLRIVQSCFESIIYRKKWKKESSLSDEQDLLLIKTAIKIKNR